MFLLNPGPVTLAVRVPGAWPRPLDLACRAQAPSDPYPPDLGRLAPMRERRNTAFTPAVHAYQATVEARAYNLPRQTTCTEMHDASKAEGFAIYAAKTTDMNRLLKCFAQLV